MNNKKLTIYFNNTSNTHSRNKEQNLSIRNTKTLEYKQIQIIIKGRGNLTNFAGCFMRSEKRGEEKRGDKGQYKKYHKYSSYCSENLQDKTIE